MPREAVEKAQGNGSWEGAVEDRIVALEGKVTTLLGENEGLKAELNKALTRAEGLEEALQAQKAAEKQRKDAEFSAYLSELTAKATKSSPIQEEKLERVRGLYQAGHEDVAREMAEAYLEAALAKGGGASPRGSAPQTVSLGAGGDDRSQTDYADDVRRRWKLDKGKE